MSGVHRRKCFDKNECVFEARVVSEPIITQIKNYRKEWIDRIDFRVVLNSNPYSPMVKTFVDLYALGWFAQAIKAVHTVGTKSIFYCEYKPKAYDKKKVLDNDQIPMRPEFEVSRFYVMVQPSVQGDIETGMVDLEAIVEASEDK